VWRAGLAADPGFWEGGSFARGSRSGVQGQSPSRGSGGQSPPEAEAFHSIIR